tara:strand:+ start:480 stop:2093 length:1614 start_codon:yes stop_codon:yes gene_type:complete
MAIEAFFTLTVDSVAGSHSGLPQLIVADNFINADANALDGTKWLNGGGNLRAYTDSGKATRLALEVVSFVTGGAPQVEVYVLIPTSATSQTIYVESDAVAIAQPAVSALYGRNAVWVDDISRLHMNQTTPIDSTGNNTPLAGVNVSIASGLNGDVLDFTGSGSYVDMGGGILPTNDFTQSIWVNPDALAGFQGFIGSWLSSEAGRTYLGSNGTSLNWDGYGVVAGRGTLVNSSWQFCTVTRTGSTVVISINGVAQGATVTDANTSPDNGHNTFIGALQEGTNYFFNGKIGENRLSNNFSSQDRILTEYDNRTTASTWWTSSGYGEASSGISITPDSVNTNYTSLNPSISLTGALSISESLVNINYTSLDPSIVFTGTVSITEQAVNTNYTTLNPAISFAGILSISEQIKNINYTSLDPIIDLTGLVSISEDLVNSNYASLAATITLTAGAVEVIESTVSTQYIPFNPSILLTPESLGIVSTVCFNGVLVDLSFTGEQKKVAFTGSINSLVFNGNFNELEFNGTIQTTCNTGSIKTNC